MNAYTKSTFLVVLCLAVLTSGMPQKRAGHSHGHGYDHPHGPAKYNYGYAVKDDYSNNNYGQSESRDGAATSGTYFVQLPDGRLQKVTYNVNGDSGYLAEVSYA